MANKITIGAIEKKDLKLLQRWRNSSQVMPYCRQYRPLSMADMESWYEEKDKDTSYSLVNDLFIISYKHNPVGVGGLVRIDWRNRKGELSFYVGEDTYRVEEVIIGSLLRIMDYGFETLNLWKIYFPVYSFNPNLSTYEKVLKREYEAKKEYYWERQYHDRIILVAYQDEYIRDTDKV